MVVHYFPITLGRIDFAIKLNFDRTSINQEFPGGEGFRSIAVSTWGADVRVPVVLGNVLTEDNARDVRAGIIVDAANALQTPAADEIFRRRVIVVLPDILADAGGVTASYFEWAQNIQQFRRELDRVRKQFEGYMYRAYRSVAENAKKHGVDFRTAAFILAIDRVGETELSRRLVSEKIGTPNAGTPGN